MASADLITLQALGFATGAALCGMMAVLQWRSSRLAGGARIHIFFWICGLIWTVPNFVRMALVLAGWPPGAPLLQIAEAIGWSSTSMGPLIGASAVGARGPVKSGRRVLIGLAAAASATLLALTLAVSFGMAFPLPVNAIAFVALGGTALFAVASGGLSALFDALAGRSGGRARWVVAAGVLLAAVELTTAFTAKLGLHSPVRQVLGILLSQQWPIPWTILVAAFLARTHYVDVVLKRSLAVVAGLALAAALLWPLLGPGLTLVAASLLSAGLMLATPTIARLLGLFVDRALLRRPDYAALAAAVAEEIRGAPDEDELKALVRRRVAEALRLDAGFGPTDGPPGPTVVRKSVHVAGRAYALDATPGNPNRTLLQAEHAFLAEVAVEASRRLEALAREAERQAHATREAALARTAAEAELKALRGQVDAHFLFNTLNAIAELVATEPAKAEAMTERLADIFRYTLSRQDHATSTLAEELEFVGKYLAIEQVRFGERLAVEMSAEPGLEDCAVPSLILQPLVENAVRHGLAPKREGGRITVTAARAGGDLELRVADDGVGLARVTSRRPGVGLANVRARLQALYGAGGRMEVGAGEDGRGAVVRLWLPADAG